MSSVRAGLRAGLSIAAGFALLAITNAVAIAATVPWPAAGLRVRLLHHLFDATGTLGLGLAAGLVIGLGAALSAAHPRLGLAAYAGVSAAILYAVLGQDLQRQANIPFGGRLERPLFALYVALAGLAVPAVHAAGARLAASARLRLLPLAAALVAIAVNHAILRDDYPGVHAAVAWGAATLAGAGAAPFLERLLPRLRRRAAAAPLIALAGAFGLLVPPPNAVRVELFREPCALAAWALAHTLWRAPGPPPAAPDSPWWRPRRGLPPIPPTTPPLASPKDLVVVLVTIDAVRADAVDDAESEHHFPTIAALRRTGAVFTRAVAPGSQTAVSLATVFSGRYFSQLVWDMAGRGDARFPYPAEDPAVRFPQILAAHGVETASFCGVGFLANAFGVARGFGEETLASRGRAHAQAADVVEPLLDRLRRAGAGPLFVYAHFMEPHAPYDRGAQRGPVRDRYLSEIGVADGALARIAGELARFGDRALLVVTSDHGEAFGEHGTRFHTKTVYEEVLRVPLVVHGPRVAARRVDQRVGLVDLGPTILDLFGLETPPTFMGQSLVPLLAGRDVAPDRPLLAEGRLRRALYLGDLKVIDDERRKLVEAYDLARDPGETTNLFDADPARVAPALAALRAFFAVHRPADPEYTPIYRP